MISFSALSVIESEETAPTQEEVQAWRQFVETATKTSDPEKLSLSTKEFKAIEEDFFKYLGLNEELYFFEHSFLQRFSYFFSEVHYIMLRLPGSRVDE